jgi:hypothetical protein
VYKLTDKGEKTINIILNAKEKNSKLYDNLIVNKSLSKPQSR